MREPDVNGYYPCDNAPECDYLVDEYMYSDQDLADSDVLVTCPRCTAREYLEDHERMEQW